MGTLKPWEADPISQEERDEVITRYPKLSWDNKGFFFGSFDLYAQYEDSVVEDVFEIEIWVPSEFPNSIPLFKEVGGRTQNIADNRGIKDLRNVHFNTINGAACVCVKQEEKFRFPSGSTITDFIEKLVVPYLFGLCTFEKTGKWPWGEYSHGCIGLLEYYAAHADQASKDDILWIAEDFKLDNNWKEYERQIHKPRGNRKCLCGSGKSIQECHALAWEGIKRLNVRLLELGLYAYQIYRK